MVRRDTVSGEALGRAIKARIALRHGIECGALTVPVVIRPKADDPSPRHWELDLSAVPPPHVAPFESAVQDLSQHLALRGADDLAVEVRPH